MERSLDKLTGGPTLAMGKTGPVEITPGDDIVLVEGESDAIVVRAVLDIAEVAAGVVVMDGVTNLARYLDDLGGPADHIQVLVDAGEIRFATGALRRHGVTAETVQELAGRNVFVCDRDLEDELIKTLGIGVVEEELAALAELSSFRTFQQMPQWRDRSSVDQLRRFAGAGSGRKARLATRLAARMQPDDLPEPLASLVANLVRRQATR